ncbi:hypothetical protein K7I13_05015 [Brucepastera parasyntrophica]|uniref:hypothetical protein n=1 Tax=Brucepastera parasyntrophica TaxID=2880008 RepID=UPI00210BF981|nr:hypothetical protein [Brucepastera parasyntrophica]ULQ60639.1 hypothetical protein K7I13_05015 [Brucepastera parasyntrophica]
MVLLITITVCGLLAFAAALILQFQLPSWLALSGLGRLPPEKKANMDIHKIRRRLSILLYFLAAGFLAGALIVYLKIISLKLLFPFFFLFILIIFDCIWFVYRHYDHNTYEQKVRITSRILCVAVNVFFLLLFFLFLNQV